MTRDQRFMLISMGRPFAPTMATPTGVVGAAARQQLIYEYSFDTGAPPAPAVFPLSATLTDSLVYRATLADAPLYNATLTDE